MTIYCATTNPGKLREFQLAAAGHCLTEVLPGLKDIEPCEETGTTFEANAVQKALYYSLHAPGPVFVDDSGLVVDAINGEPGVYSARYSGSNATDASNNALVLERMLGVSNRAARFVCVVAIAKNGKLLRTFEGTVEGELLESPQGDGGFGYDPLFYYPPYGCTLADVTGEQKLTVSHRGKALQAMFQWIAEGGMA